MVTWDLMY